MSRASFAFSAGGLIVLLCQKAFDGEITDAPGSA